jgi:coenzyme F420-reducing hydrogenase gamma subunit
MVFSYVITLFLFVRLTNAKEFIPGDEQQLLQLANKPTIQLKPSDKIHLPTLFSGPQSRTLADPADENQNFKKNFEHNTICMRVCTWCESKLPRATSSLCFTGCNGREAAMREFGACLARYMDDQEKKKTSL